MAKNDMLPSPHPNDWVKGKVIGYGSFGTVHLAMSKATGALFVVKSARTDAAAAIASLKNEADILEDINSPYVVRCLGRDFRRVTNSENELSIFLEYISGGSLVDIAEKFGGSLDEEVIRLYTREILHGLNCLHQNGIVHCDLKGKNVLLCPSGRIKLADFGCAKRLGFVSPHSSASLVGTPLWMAPEVLRNEGTQTASDIWSLGCTVIEMATGRPPWSDRISSPEAALMKIGSSNEIPQFPKSFSEDGLDFLATCLVRDPKKRPTAKELLNHPFVMGNSTSNSMNRRKDADSPASVLMFQCDIDDFGADEGEQSNEFVLFKRIPFSTKCNKNANIFTELQKADDALGSSCSWITVR